jgi:hypothetical protein
MFSIEEARSAHTHATYNIAAGVRREYGTESIIRELEIAATQARTSRRDVLRQALRKLYQLVTGRNPQAVSRPQIATDAALGVGN